MSYWIFAILQLTTLWIWDGLGPPGELFPAAPGNCGSPWERICCNSAFISVDWFWYWMKDHIDERSTLFSNAE